MDTSWEDLLVEDSRQVLSHPGIFLRVLHNGNGEPDVEPAPEFDGEDNWDLLPRGSDVTKTSKSVLCHLPWAREPTRFLSFATWRKASSWIRFLRMKGAREIKIVVIDDIVQRLDLSDSEMVHGRRLCSFRRKESTSCGMERWRSQTGYLP